MTPVTPTTTKPVMNTMTIHTIELTIDLKNKKRPIKVVPLQKRIGGGQYLVWKVKGNKVPFIISFMNYGNEKQNSGHHKESPFWCEELTDDGAAVPQKAIRGGTFRYSIQVLSNPPCYLDPEVVVDPPTYP